MSASNDNGGCPPGQPAFAGFYRARKGEGGVLA
jgi:hypothetical protein